MTDTAERPAISILLVCMGNICRSPMAHGVVRYRLQQKQLFERIRVDSAGTHGYHAGAPPDDRAQRGDGFHVDLIEGYIALIGQVAVNRNPLLILFALRRECGQRRTR